MILFYDVVKKRILEDLFSLNRSGFYKQVRNDWKNPKNIYGI